MEQQTTTATDDTQDSGAAALPDQSTEQAAALAANEQKDDSKGGDEPLPEVDEKLRSFAKGLGIEDVAGLSDREMQLLKVAKDNQAEYQRTQQKASQLEKTIQSSLSEDIQNAQASGNVELVEQLAAEVQGLKLAQNVNSFFTANPEAKEFEGKMSELVTDRPEISQLIKGGYLTMDDLYKLARGSDASRDQSLKTEGGREALQKVADKQQARAITGSATTSALGSSVTKENFNEWYSGLSAADRAKPENQEIVNSLLS